MFLLLIIRTQKVAFISWTQVYLLPGLLRLSRYIAQIIRGIKNVVRLKCGVRSVCPVGGRGKTLTEIHAPIPTKTNHAKVLSVWPEYLNLETQECAYKYLSISDKWRRDVLVGRFWRVDKNGWMKRTDWKCDICCEMTVFVNSFELWVECAD